MFGLHSLLIDIFLYMHNSVNTEYLYTLSLFKTCLVKVEVKTIVKPLNKFESLI